jgi:DMSO/TMAO reductase YedYZ molybdopterin-dependent catalytic subunit
MGGVPGDPSPGAFRLRVHGEVEHELELTFAELLALPQTEQLSDVHCVTTWSLFDVRVKGVRVSELARRAGVKPSARHVIFEAAAGYTANVPLAEAIAPDVLLAHQIDGKPLAMPHGPPVRAFVPSLYYWKSAKWLTGVKFVTRDEPGFWETRGYHNHADPWLEERYG